MIKLVDISRPKQWKTISGKDLLDDGYPVYGANGMIGYWSEYNHENETIAIGCRGTCGEVNIVPAKSYINGNAMCLDDLSDDVEIRYLYYYLKWYDLKKIISGSTIPQITIEGLKKVEVKVFSKERQKEIVIVLDKLSHAIDNRRIELAKLDNLIKARFVEMFGDAVINPYGLPEAELGSVAKIVSGITKGRKIKTEELYEVPYMAVSNVKDGYIDWNVVKTIMASKSEIDQYRLEPGDVLMTEGGDPDKLGRGAIIKDPPINCIHQNHIFRVRLNREMILPVYLEQYLQQQRSKRYFLSCAKQTTGIATINMKQLSGLPVLLPSIEEQRQYAEFVDQVYGVKNSIQSLLESAKTMMNSLMQEYFG